MVLCLSGTLNVDAQEHQEWVEEGLSAGKKVIRRPPQQKYRRRRFHPGALWSVGATKF